MAVGRKVKEKSWKKRDEKSEQTKSRQARNLSVKGDEAKIHQVVNTQRKYYSAKTFDRSKRDLKSKVGSI